MIFGGLVLQQQPTARILRAVELHPYSNNIISFGTEN